MKPSISNKFIKGRFLADQQKENLYANQGTQHPTLQQFQILHQVQQHQQIKKPPHEKKPRFIQKGQSQALGFANQNNSNPYQHSEEPETFRDGNNLQFFTPINNNNNNQDRSISGGQLDPEECIPFVQKFQLQDQSQGNEQLNLNQFLLEGGQQEYIDFVKMQNDCQNLIQQNINLNSTIMKLNLDLQNEKQKQQITEQELQQLKMLMMNESQKLQTCKVQEQDAQIKLKNLATQLVKEKANQEVMQKKTEVLQQEKVDNQKKFNSVMQNLIKVLQLILNKINTFEQVNQTLNMNDFQNQSLNLLDQIKTNIAQILDCVTPIIIENHLQFDNNNNNLYQLQTYSITQQQSCNNNNNNKKTMQMIMPQCQQQKQQILQMNQMKTSTNQRMKSPAQNTSRKYHIERDSRAVLTQRTNPQNNCNHQQGQNYIESYKPLNSRLLKLNQDSSNYSHILEKNTSSRNLMTSRSVNNCNKSMNLSSGTLQNNNYLNNSRYKRANRSTSCLQQEIISSSLDFNQLDEIDKQEETIQSKQQQSQSLTPAQLESQQQDQAPSMDFNNCQILNFQNDNTESTQNVETNKSDNQQDQDNVLDYIGCDYKEQMQLHQEEQHYSNLESTMNFGMQNAVSSSQTLQTKFQQENTQQQFQSVQQSQQKANSPNQSFCEEISMVNEQMINNEQSQQREQALTIKQKKAELPLQQNIQLIQTRQTQQAQMQSFQQISKQFNEQLLQQQQQQDNSNIQIDDIQRVNEQINFDLEHKKTETSQMMENIKQRIQKRKNNKQESDRNSTDENTMQSALNTNSNVLSEITNLQQNKLATIQSTKTYKLKDLINDSIILNEQSINNKENNNQLRQSIQNQLLDQKLNHLPNSKYKISELQSSDNVTKSN